MTALLLIAVTALLVATALLVDRHRLARRAREVELATDLLDEHETALKTFLNDADAPEPLRRLLLDLLDALEDEATVAALASHVIGSCRADPSDSRLQKELDRLAAVRPDLRDAFLAAGATGFVVSVLRFDSTASLFQRLAAVLAAHPKREFHFAVTKAGKWFDGSDTSGWGDRPAAVAA